MWNRTYGIEVFPCFSSRSHLGWLQLTVHLIFFGRLCDFSVFSQQSLQCHPQAEVSNTYVERQNVKNVTRFSLYGVINSKTIFWIWTIKCVKYKMWIKFFILCSPSMYLNSLCGESRGKRTGSNTSMTCFFRFATSWRTQSMAAVNTWYSSSILSSSLLRSLTSWSFDKPLNSSVTHT